MMSRVVTLVGVYTVWPQSGCDIVFVCTVCGIGLERITLSP